MLSYLRSGSEKNNESEYIAAYNRITHIINIANQYTIRDFEFEELEQFLKKYNDKSHYIIFDKKHMSSKIRDDRLILQNIYNQEDYNKLRHNEQMVFEKIDQKILRFSFITVLRSPDIHFGNPNTLKSDLVLTKFKNIKIASRERIEMAHKLEQEGLFLNTQILKDKPVEIAQNIPEPKPNLNNTKIESNDSKNIELEENEESEEETNTKGVKLESNKHMKHHKNKSRNRVKKIEQLPLLQSGNMYPILENSIKKPVSIDDAPPVPNHPLPPPYKHKHITYSPYHGYESLHGEKEFVPMP